MAHKFGAFVMGGLVGAGIALLCAPRKGVETRALVADKASAAFGQAQVFGGQAAERGQELYSEAVASGQRAYDSAVAAGQTVYTDVTVMGKQAYESAAQHVQDAAQRVQNTAETVRPAFSDKNDELRAKIDAARERIAAQVAKNAEAAHAAVTEKVPVAARKVNEVVDAAQEKMAAAAAALAGDGVKEEPVVQAAPVAEAAVAVQDVEAKPVEEGKAE